MTTQLQLLTPHLDDPPARGAGLAALISVAGLAVSLWISWLKFRVDHLCDTTGCTGDAQRTWLSCDEALDSAWSVVLGAPVSMYATALFTVTLALAVSLMRRRGWLWPAARPLLLVGGLLGVGASTAFGGFALRHFAHLCPYCLTIYVISGLLLVAAIRVCLGRRVLRRLFTAIRARSQAVIDASLLVATCFAFVMVAQIGVYQRAAASATCERPTAMPPEPTIRHPFGDTARNLVLIFADPACARCRNEVHLLRQSLAKFVRHTTETPWDGAELWMYPLPLDACDTSQPSQWFVDRDGQPLTSGEAQFHNACLAARAIECVAKLSPEHGLTAFGELYNLQDTRPPYFTFEKIQGALRYTVSADLDIAALQTCVDSHATTERLHTYQAYFAEWCQEKRSGGCSVPQAFVVPILGGVPRMDQATPADSIQKILHTLQAEP